MRSTKIIFWATTGLIFLTQGLLPIFTTQSPQTKEAMSHLGYPAYFPLMLAIFKLAGGIALILPQIKGRVKEWAYAGFGIDFIAALVSIVAIEGFHADAFFPIIGIVILIASYLSYHKLTGALKKV